MGSRTATAHQASPDMSFTPFDQNAIGSLLERVLKAHEALSPEDHSSGPELRAGLQGLALIEEIPAEVAKAAMAAARLLKSAELDDPAVLEELASFIEEVCGGLQLEAPEADAESAAEAEAEAEDEAESVEEAQSSEPSEDGAESQEAPADGEGQYMRGCSDPDLADFLEETREHLESSEEQLLELEESPDHEDALNSVFRSFHSIKGGAGVLDLDELCRLAHSAESVLDLAREGQIQLVGHPVDQCYAALDIMKHMVEGLASGEERFPLPGNFEHVVDQLESVASAGAGNPGVSPAAEASPSEQAAPATQADAKAETSAAEPSSSAEIVPAAPPAAKESAPKKSKGTGSVKIGTERLDTLINLVGELVIATAMVQQGVGQTRQLGAELPRSLSQLGKVTAELQHMAMSMRMVPLKQTFQKSARLVRDVAAKCGKRVQFKTAGEDTELDRNVVERLSDPLIHMLRNAVDHGVEDAESRKRAGKPEVGQIKLEAYHESGSVVLVLSDDGAGMNRERILAKAIGSGLLTEAQAQAMPDSEVWHLIFHPGLSTAQTVSSVSGRGVGMDVVRKNIEALRGSIDIESTPGSGSRVIIRLPLTLAIIDAMVVVVGGRSYILPTLTIQSFLRPDADAISTIQDRGELLSIRERVLPIYRLSELLKTQSTVQDPTEGLLVITSADGHDFALLVDDLEGQQQVVIKGIGSNGKSNPGVSGAAILGDGTVGLILDPAGLARLAQTSAGIGSVRPALQESVQ